MFLFVLLLFCDLQESIAQQKFRTITVIIDTVVVLHPKEILNEVYVYATHKMSDLSYDDKPYDTGYSKNRYPNYINTVKIREKLFVSSKINIPIDEQGSYLSIHNLFNLPGDTLRINKVVQWSNCYTDTTYVRQEYYKYKIENTLGKPYKIKFKRKINKYNCKRQPPESTHYIINGQKYEVHIRKLSNAIEFESGQGYRPKRLNRKDSESLKGKEITQVYFYSRTRKYYNGGEIYLKPIKN